MNTNEIRSEVDRGAAPAVKKKGNMKMLNLIFNAFGITLTRYGRLRRDGRPILRPHRFCVRRNHDGSPCQLR
jgi:hypothetical protein